MLNLFEQLSDIQQHAFETQWAIWNKISTRTFEHTQKMMALNFRLGQFFLQNSPSAPSVMAPATYTYPNSHPNSHQNSHPNSHPNERQHAHRHPGIEQIFDYERELLHILTNANADLLTCATSEVSEIRDTINEISAEEIAASLLYQKNSQPARSNHTNRA